MSSTIEHTQATAASDTEVKSAKFYDASTPYSEDMVDGQVNLLGNPFILRVKEASECLKKIEKRILMLQGQLRNARAQYAQEIGIYNELIADLQGIVETGTVKGDVMPSCESSARRLLRKDQRKAVRALKDHIPEDLKEALRKYDWHVNRIRADETFEYMDLARKRRKALSRSDLEGTRDCALEGTLEFANFSQPNNELAEEALKAGIAYQDRHWQKHIREDDAELERVDPRSDITAAHENPVTNDVDRARSEKVGFTAGEGEWNEHQPERGEDAGTLDPPPDQVELNSDTDVNRDNKQTSNHADKSMAVADCSDAGNGEVDELTKGKGSANPQGP